MCGRGSIPDQKKKKKRYILFNEFSTELYE